MPVAQVRGQIQAKGERSALSTKAAPGGAGSSSSERVRAAAGGRTTLVAELAGATRGIERFLHHQPTQSTTSGQSPLAKAPLLTVWWSTPALWLVFEHRWPYR